MQTMYSYNIPPCPAFIIKADCVLIEVKEMKAEEDLEHRA
jgi:hypothetical protein